MVSTSLGVGATAGCAYAGFLNPIDLVIAVYIRFLTDKIATLVALLLRGRMLAASGPLFIREVVGAAAPVALLAFGLTQHDNRHTCISLWMVRPTQIIRMHLTISTPASVPAGFSGNRGHYQNFTTRKIVLSKASVKVP